MLLVLICKSLNAHRSIAEIPLQRDSPSTLLKVVRDTVFDPEAQTRREYTEKCITYRLKTRIAGVPIISNSLKRYLTRYTRFSSLLVMLGSLPPRPVAIQPP
jgi:hypothetical protein